MSSITDEGSDLGLVVCCTDGVDSVEGPDLCLLVGCTEDVAPLEGPDL